MYDKFKVHIYDKKRVDNDTRSEHKYYVRLVYTIESLMHSLGDQQLIAGIALLLVVNHQACQISAYHYNLVCTMLLMSIITHLNTLINIPDFLYKGKTVATYRLIGIFAQFVLSGIVLSARNTSTFPSQPSSLAIMPAACFENMNATQDLGFSDFVGFAQNVTMGSAANTTANVTQILHNIDVATSAVSGLGEYVTLVFFMIFAVVVLAFDYVEAVAFWDSKIMRGVSMFFSGASIFASTVIVGLALYRYNGLRIGMEVQQWYRSADEDDWTLSQILTILLAGSGFLAFLKAVTGERYLSRCSYAYCRIYAKSNP
jgi:hypothetical protein